MQDYNLDAGFTVRTTFRSPWRFISHVYPDSSPMVKLKVKWQSGPGFGRGWVTLHFQFVFHLLIVFDSLQCSILNVHHTPINFFLSNNGQSSFPLSWNFHFFRNLREAEIHEVGLLLECLESVNLLILEMDYRV